MPHWNGSRLLRPFYFRIPEHQPKRCYGLATSPIPIRPNQIAVLNPSPTTKVTISCRFMQKMGSNRNPYLGAWNWLKHQNRYPGQPAGAMRSSRSVLTSCCSHSQDVYYPSCESPQNHSPAVSTIVFRNRDMPRNHRSGSPALCCT